MYRRLHEQGEDRSPAPVPSAVTEPPRIASLYELYNVIKDNVAPEKKGKPMPAPKMEAFDMWLEVADPEDRRVWKLSATFKAGDQYQEPTWRFYVAEDDGTELKEVKTKRNPSIKRDRDMAEEIYNKVDLDAIYALMETQAFEMLQDLSLHFEILMDMCDIKYVRKGTAYCDRKLGSPRYEIGVNREFVVKTAIEQLLNGFPHSTLEQFEKLFGGDIPKMMAQWCLAIFVHEIGHIIYRHSSKKSGFYDDYKHSHVNKWGDCLINLQLTNLLWSKTIQPAFFPHGFYTNTVSYKARVKDGLAYVEALMNLLQKFGKLGHVGGKGLHNIPVEPMNVICKFHPMGLIMEGAATNTLIHIYQDLIKNLGMQEIDKPDAPPIPPPEHAVVEELQIGQVVRELATGRTAVVVGIEPEVDEDTGRQIVNIVYYEDLSVEAQQRIDRMREAGPDTGQAFGAVGAGTIAPQSPTAGSQQIPQDNTPAVNPESGTTGDQVEGLTYKGELLTEQFAPSPVKLVLSPDLLPTGDAKSKQKVAVGLVSLTWMPPPPEPPEGEKGEGEDAEDDPFSGIGEPPQEGPPGDKFVVGQIVALRASPKSIGVVKWAGPVDARTGRQQLKIIRFHKLPPDVQQVVLRVLQKAGIRPK